MKHQQESAFYDGLRAERGIFFVFFFKYKNDFPFKVKGSENSDLAWKASEKVSFQGYFRLDQVLSHGFCFDLYRSLLSRLSPLTV